jgi:hypothetical protein
MCSDYKEYHTDTTVKFIVKMSAEKLAQAEETGLHKVFKLQSNVSSNMVSPVILCADYKKTKHSFWNDSSHLSFCVKLLD